MCHKGEKNTGGSKRKLPRDRNAEEVGTLFQPGKRGDLAPRKRKKSREEEDS